jgi:alkylhydroperoxidase/carboxymuconolactone decarboxylase family protein YurZ
MTTPASAKIKKVNIMEKEHIVGYLPDVYVDFMKRYPDIGKTYASLDNSCHEAGPLDQKTRRLIKLGIAIGINSEGSVRSHARRALEEGISPEEIRQVVLLAFTTVGFPTMIAAYKWVEEVLAKVK